MFAACLGLFIIGTWWGGSGIFKWARHVAGNGHDHSKNDGWHESTFNIVFIACSLGPFYDKVFKRRGNKL
jgi:hypothetical protein